MTVQYSATHRTNNMTDIVTQAGTTGHLAIFTGAAPANCGTADAGTLIVSIPLSNPIGTVSAGVLTLSGTPLSAAAAAAGTAGHFRIFPTATTTGTDAVLQGAVATSGAELNFAAGVAFTVGETITITGFTDTATGA